MKQGSHATISVVMVSWHTGPVLVEAIEAALAAPDVFELVLVNHGNPAEMVHTLEALAQKHERMVLVHSGGNLGFAKGCNIGARAARGDFVFFLNPDTVLMPGTASRMADTAAGLNDPFVIGARLLDTDGREQRGARRGDLNLLSAFLGFTGLGRHLPFWRDIHREHEPLPDRPVDIPCVSGAALMMSAAGYRAMEGFDERYFLHVEDIDLCHRVRRAGGRVIFDPEAQLFHYGSTSRVSALFVESHKARGLLRYFWRYASPLKRVAVVLAAPLLYLAIMGRALILQAERRSAEAKAAQSG